MDIAVQRGFQLSCELKIHMVPMTLWSRRAPMHTEAHTVCSQSAGLVDQKALKLNVSYIIFNIRKKSYKHLSSPVLIDYYFRSLILLVQINNRFLFVYQYGSQKYSMNILYINSVDFPENYLMSDYYCCPFHTRDEVI